MLFSASAIKDKLFVVVVSTGKLFMKIRQGHVSNSSSSSFIVVIKDEVGYVTIRQFEVILSE